MDEYFKLQLRGYLPLVVELQLVLLFAFGQFEGLLSYFSLPDLARLFWATFCSFAIVLLIWLASRGAYAPPRGVIMSDFLISFLGLAGTRLGFRLLRERYLAPYSRHGVLARRVGVVGAGDVGASLVNDLFSKRGLGLLPVGFFDDDRKKWGSRIHGVPVIGAPETILEKNHVLDLEQIIIAMPTAPAKRISEIVKLLQKGHLKFEIVPAMDQLATGQLKVSQIRPVEIQDLLGREPVDIETEKHQGNPGQPADHGHGRRRQHRQRVVPSDCRLSPGTVAVGGPIRGAIVRDRAGTDQPRLRRIHYSADR